MTFPDSVEGFEELEQSVPPVGEQVEVLCRQKRIVRPLAFLCCWTNDDGWVIAGTRRKVSYEVLGWRRNPRA